MLPNPPCHHTQEKLVVAVLVVAVFVVFVIFSP